MDDERRSDTFTTAPGAHLDVRTDRGDITVEPGEAGRIDIAATLRWPGDISYVAHLDGNRVMVEAVINHRLMAAIFGGQRPRCDIRVRAPRDTVLELRAASGAIEVERMEAGGALRTANGRIVLSDASGGFELRTSNGKVIAGGISGAMDVRTSNGVIELEEIEGPVRARTSNGAIQAHIIRGPVQLRTSNGGISALLDLPHDGENRAETTNGSINIDLMGQPDLRIDARAGSGRVRVALPTQQFHAEGRKVSGQVGAATALLYVRTTNGKVSIGQAG